MLKSSLLKIVFNILFYLKKSFKAFSSLNDNEKKIKTRFLKKAFYANKQNAHV